MFFFAVSGLWLCTANTFAFPFHFSERNGILFLITTITEAADLIFTLHSHCRLTNNYHKIKVSLNYFPIPWFPGARTFPAQSFPPDGTTFSQISLGQRLSKEIPPYGYWNMQFYQSEAAYILFDYIIPRGASIGVYARRNALPTHTQYHILEVLSGFKARVSRANHVSTN